MKRIYLVSLIVFSLLIMAGQAGAFPRKSVPAKAAVVMDSSGAVLYAKYPKARLAPASTVKLMTAMVVLDHRKPEDLVTISRNASRVKTIPPGICPEEEMTIADLLHLALMRSINSSAVALAEATAGTEEAFVVLMNQKARDLGADDTLFANASGLPRAGTQYSTANDLAIIMRAALAYPLIREILATKEYTIRTAAGREIYVDNSNHLLWEDQSTILGKTGYTGNARHCFVGAVNTDRGPVFTAVLGARSRSSLWRATEMLAEIGTHPELADTLEAPSRFRLAGRTGVKKNKPVAAADVPQGVSVEDIQRSRLQGVFSHVL